MKLNGKALAHAKSLIASGDVDRSDSWSFSAEDGNKLLGKDGSDWSNYAKWFLAENPDAAEETKDRYHYPFGKDGKVYRSAVVAIRQRAGQQSAKEIFDAAGELLTSIDKNKGSDLQHGSIVANNIVAQGNQGRSEVDVLVDTGASQSFVMRKVAEKLGVITKLPSKLSFTLADGSSMDIVDGIVLVLSIAGRKVIDTFLVVEDTVADIVLGESTMRKYGMKIDLEHNAIYASVQDSFTINQNNNPEGTTMKEFLKVARQAFALADDSSEQDLITKFNEMHSAAKNAQPLASLKENVYSILSLKPEATVEEAKAKLASATGNAASMQQLTSELNALKAERTGEKFLTVIEGGLRSGRISTAQKDNANWLGQQKSWAEKDFPSFQKYFGEEAPVIVPIGHIAISQKGEGSNVMTDEEKKVCAAMGLTEEQYLATKKKAS